MMGFKIEKLRQPIAVMRPVYTQNGDACEVITDNGESHFDLRSIKSVKRALARSYALDLKANNVMVSEMLGQGGVLPFYLDKGKIYTPFKMRRPLASGDYCYGYVRQDQVDDIIIQTSTPYISLKNGSVLELFSSLAAARHNLEAGRRLSLLLAPPADEEQMVIEAIKTVLAWLRK